MYLYYKQGIIPPMPVLEEGMKIVKHRPCPFVENMKFMQIGRKHHWYYTVMTFLYRGFSRVYEEYDIVVDNKILSKAVLISKVPLYKFLPFKGIHLGYCETIPEARGRGLYPFLLSYIQNVDRQANLYMIVDESNISSIKGIEKAGFIKYAVGQKTSDGRFIITSRL